MMIVELMSLDDVLRYVKPETPRESVILEHLRQVARDLNELRDVLDRAYLSGDAVKLSAEFDKLESYFGDFKGYLEL